MKRSRPDGVLVAVFFLILTGFVFFTPLPGEDGGEPAERYFQVEASAYSFEPAVLRVEPGDRVTIDLVALDVVHGLYLDGYDMEITADPGQTARLVFSADRAGVFRFRCAVACGTLHPFMTGVLQVGPNRLFQRAALLAVLTVALVPLIVRTLGRPVEEGEGID